MEEQVKKFGGERYFTTIFLLFAFLSCSPEEISPTEKEEIKFTYSVLELEILGKINAYRNSKGLNELEILDEISRQARLHNEHMLKAGEVCHHNFGGRYQILVRQVRAKAMGENVGFGFRNPEALVKAWLKSKGHRKVIEQSNSHFGISAIGEEKEKVYFTLILIRK